MRINKCIVCKKEFETTDEKLAVCYDCHMDGSFDRMVEKEREEQEQNRKEWKAFRKYHCDDDTNPDLYEDNPLIAGREFPNRIRMHRTSKDFHGKPIPTHVVLIHGPSSTFGVKIRGEEIYGLYGNDKGNEWWVSLKDADLYALRQYGYSRICT